MKDIAIAYRIYPGVTKVPALHATDKFELSRFCLRSFRQALGNLSFKIWAILDGCPPEYADLFRSVFREEELEIIEVPALGNLKTFSRQIDLLARQTESELVYFAEDDYFYFPNALVEMVEFAKHNDEVDFVTPYDHPDSYFTSSSRERHIVKPFGRRHWKTATSTCLTFLAKRSSLLATEAVMRSYSRGNMDCSLWLALTQKVGLANPAVHAADRVRIKIWGKTWIWGWKNILFSKVYRLWSPMPTLSTHMESSCLSPLVEWQAEFALVETQQAGPPGGSGEMDESSF
jgi:hypothetical protein